jgi:hypothetical protein
MPGIKVGNKNMKNKNTKTKNKVKSKNGWDECQY